MDPLGIMEERRAPEGYDEVLWLGTEDGTDLTVNYISADYSWIAVIEVRTSIEMILVHRSVGYTSFVDLTLFSDLPRAVETIVATIDPVPGVTLSGGLVNGMTSEDNVTEFIHDVSIIVSGSFRDFPQAMGRVTTQGGFASVQVDAFLER